MISIRRGHAGNVQRWRDGQMALRWCAAGMLGAGKQFRRVNATCTFRRCAPRSSGISASRMSAPTATMRP